MNLRGRKKEIYGIKTPIEEQAQKEQPLLSLGDQRKMNSNEEKGNKKTRSDVVKKDS